MVTPHFIDKNFLYEIVPIYILGKVTKFGGFSLLKSYKVVNVQSPCGQNPPPPHELCRVNRHTDHD